MIKFVKAKFKKTDRQTNTDKCRVAAHQTIIWEQKLKSEYLIWTYLHFLLWYRDAFPYARGGGGQI